MPNDLYTPQGETLSGTPWPCYPRPQMRRDSYVNLNDTWDFTVAPDHLPAAHYDWQIQVPFCPESLLSGIHRQFSPGSHLCYRRKFSLPTDFSGGKVLLHVGAADQIADIYVNQIHICHHEGGYEAFTADITAALREENELVISVVDRLDTKVLPYGKQTEKRGGMWYTPVSGIWQSVWLEQVPAEYIHSLSVENRGYSVTVTIDPPLDGTITVPGLGQFPLSRGKVTITPENPRLWSPEDPYLYDFSVETAQDRVESYFAIRALEVKTLRGIPRLCLNGKPYFFHGLLDQGYWPDGLFTPATPECYAADILAMKKLGFNTLRKHIKVEAEEFYYQCDKLGMVVFQDMVNNGDYSFLRDTLVPTLGIQKWPDKNLNKDPATRQAFLDGMRATVNQLKSHPCIVSWTIFNEAWGQFDADNAYGLLKKLDDTRFIDSTSGWFRQKQSDVESLHIYFNLWHRLKQTDKPLVLSEFGGFTCSIEGHLFNPDNTYGYKTCTDLTAFRSAFDTLYRTRVLPAARKGLCAAIYTQVSDVEDEINGLLTYDRKICKGDEASMQALAAELQAAVNDGL